RVERTRVRLQATWRPQARHADGLLRTWDWIRRCAERGTGLTDLSLIPLPGEGAPPGGANPASVDTPAAQIELVRPWRTATLIASCIAGLELVLLVVLGVVVLGRSVAPHVREAAAKAARAPKHHAAPTPASAKVAHVRRPARAAHLLARSKTAVLILNGNGINGAAAQAASI